MRWPCSPTELASASDRSTRWRRSVEAAKLIRTWKAMRVFSGKTVTGPDLFSACSRTSLQKCD